MQSAPELRKRHVERRTVRVVRRQVHLGHWQPLAVFRHVHTDHHLVPVRPGVRYTVLRGHDPEPADDGAAAPEYMVPEHADLVWDFLD
uniref:Uncharacterized protein n=1 Tax=Anopheles atroparvus TaxID=41427 RepID=A0AAG5D8G0_ANOAO